MLIDSRVSLKLTFARLGLSVEIQWMWCKINLERVVWTLAQSSPVRQSMNGFLSNIEWFPARRNNSWVIRLPSVNDSIPFLKKDLISQISNQPKRQHAQVGALPARHIKFNWSLQIMTQECYHSERAVGTWSLTLPSLVSSGWGSSLGIRFGFHPLRFETRVRHFRMTSQLLHRISMQFSWPYSRTM